jgi:hypothetical protein
LKLQRQNRRDDHERVQKSVNTKCRRASNLLEAAMREDVKVTLFNTDVALVTYKVTEKGSFKGEQLSSKPCYAGSEYLKRTGKWVNIYTQTTLARQLESRFA